MIRFVICISWTVIFLILSIPAILVELIIWIFSPMARARSSQWIICNAFRILVFLAGTKVEVIGEENVLKDRPVLYVPNHRSIFDIILTYIRAPRQTAYIAKKETRRIPIFSIWMALMNCQFLNRDDLRDGLRVINKAADLIAGGSSVCIFPEGTRNKGTEPLQPFHDGSLKIAEKAKCPIIPVVINNSDDIFEAHLPKVKKTKVIIEYCKPIETEGMSHIEFKKISPEIQELMRNTYLKNAEHVNR